MKNKTTQLSFIKDCLLSNGEISRNQCLKHYISRLGSRIFDLRKIGWKFITERRGNDYVYKIQK